MPIKRLNVKDQESYIIMLMFQEAKKHPQDNQWRKFDATVRVGDVKYRITADFVLRGQMFSYNNLEVKRIERETLILH